MADNKSAIETVSHFDEILNKIYNAVENGINEHGQTVVDGALTMFRIQAGQEIFTAIVFLIVIIVFNLKLKAKCDGWYQKGIKNGDSEASTFYIPFAISISISLAIGLNLTNTIMNIYNWIALFGHPEFKIAHSILQSQGLM